ncbi:MAG TPA: hypothetical protein VN633_04530 [Bryobacteraceae bacterium]|nr:hypothetical protein [Bryobacteraceae bacterium]
MPWAHRSFWLLPLFVAAVLGLLSFIVSHGKLREIYRRQFPNVRRERLFLGSVGFFTTAVVVRIITVLIHHDVGPFHNVSFHGRHIHHLVWGILTLLVVGYSWLSQVGTGGQGDSRWMSRFTAMLFGVGAALTLDEFALWLNLSDVYWQRQGRESYEALALFGGLLAVGWLGGPFFRGIGREISRRFATSSKL